MTISDSAADFIEVPVNLNGVLRVRKPKNLTVAEASAMAVQAFQGQINRPHTFGESGQNGYVFEGNAWSTEGHARIGNLGIEVRHDVVMGVSGAMVALAPAEGAYGADRFRCRVTAYVTRDAAYITARDPRNDCERVMCLVNITDGDVTAHVMEPSGNDNHCDEVEPAVSVRFRNMCSALN